MFQRKNLYLLAIPLFLLWAAVFIWQTSFIAMDGQRYFSLADDAMISMRYAWNFSHGLGLVWNAGERVEGYTNLLMTLIMSVATALFDKKLAVLVIQVLGIPTVLGTALITRKIARTLYDNNTLADLAFIGILFYVPLSFWSLLGMESGLLTLLIAAGLLCMLLYIKNRELRHLWLLALFLGLAFLTRNESVLLTGLIFGYLAYHIWKSGGRKTEWASLFYALLIYAVFVIGQLLFRLSYYGTWVPNTYLLKVTGIPFMTKLQWGAKYVSGFLTDSAVLLAIALFEVLRKRDKNSLLIGFIAILLLYETSVGGDSFGLWRILLPGMPFVFILAAAWLVGLNQWLLRKVSPTLQPYFAALPLVLLLANLVLINLSPLDEIYMDDGKNIQAYFNEHNVNVAIGIQALTTSDASVGVMWAGVIPYYTGRHGVDFLGKMDPYIASQPAHLDMTLVGHNKYDLQYSIHKLQPTYIQNFEWNKENLKPWVVKHYLRANYITPYGDITLILKRDDPSVLWSNGTIIPWPEDTAKP